MDGGGVRVRFWNIGRRSGWAFAAAAGWVLRLWSFHCVFHFKQASGSDRWVGRVDRILYGQAVFARNGIPLRVPLSPARGSRTENRPQSSR